MFLIARISNGDNKGAHRIAACIDCEQKDDDGSIQVGIGPRKNGEQGKREVGWRNHPGSHAVGRRNA